MRISRHDGYSLIEVLMAIALLGALVVGASSLLSFVSHHTNGTRSSMTAHLLAVERMEETLWANYNSLHEGTDIESPISGYATFSSSVEIVDEGPSLKRVIVTVTGDGSEAVLETLLADR